MVTFRLGTSLLVPPNVKVALELAAPSGFHFQEALGTCKFAISEGIVLSPHFIG